MADQRSRHILISAGPGSGKTRVLVHKVASLLLQEDVRLEQFMMLTFSRLAGLVGPAAYHLDIFTFHAYAFRLFESKGQLKEADDILARAQRGEVLIATMHKSKGQEFDHVFVIAEDFALQNDARWRQLYVACTRAKSFLSLHTNRPELARIQPPEAQIFQHPEAHSAPRELRLSCGLRDVNLAGLKLLFSRAFQQQLQKRFQTHQLLSAEIRYLVVWLEPQSQQEYRIPLPELHLVQP